jgi:CRISPR-associated endonuclease Csn1
MREGKDLYEAIEKANFVKGWTQQKFLPLPSRDNGINIPNPIVTTVLFQLRKIVNALIRELGKPKKIVVEFARELKASKDFREEIVEEQAENQSKREECIKRIKEYHRWDEDVEVSATDVLKYRLWEQQNGFCPYSLRKIGIEQLLSTDTEVDHILPYSMSLDNSMNNKIVCFANDNQAKGQNSPIDWLGETSERFKKIAEAIEKGMFDFDKAKRERFFVHNEEIAEKYTPERLLQDTSYIAREVRSYVKRLYPASESEKCVKTTKGGITAELRNIWGLNAILREGEVGPKKRDDLRHHAIDAAVIAITEPGIIKKITDKLKSNWPRRPSRTAVDEPWNGFGLELAKVAEKVNISHRVLRKVKGALHKETNYWKETNGPHAGKYITRKELNGKFTTDWAEKICDEEIKKIIMDRLAQYEQDAKKAFAEPLYLPNDKGKQIPIRKVRVWQTSSNMMQLRPNIWVEPGYNHHVEIFEIKDKKGKTKQDGLLVTTFEAYKRKLSGQPIIQKNQGVDKKFTMSLSKNEMVLLKLDDGLEILHRTQKMSQKDGKVTIILRPHIYGGKLSDYDKPPIIQRRSPSTLSGRKVTVDPLGRIRWAND